MSNNIDCEKIYNAFIDSLKLLAADYNTQIQSLPEFVVVADEIVFYFTHWYETLMSQQEILDEHFDSQQKQMLTELNKRIDKLDTSGHDIWSKEALKNHDQWKELRLLSSEILKSIGVDWSPPRLQTETYISND